MFAWMIRRLLVPLGATGEAPAAVDVITGRAVRVVVYGPGAALEVTFGPWSAEAEGVG